MMQAALKDGVPVQALQEKVYLQLKERIVNCEMLPGAVISEDLLAGEFGTSRTPIREALLRLQRENLVVIYPRQGTFVSQISLKDIYEIYQIRLIIEPKVARISCRSMDPAVLERFRDLFDGLDVNTCSYGEWFRHDRDLHGYIVDCAGNRHLKLMYGTIMDQNQRMRILAGKIPMRISDTNKEHGEIVNALLSKDEDRIEQVMCSHVLASRDAALRIDGYVNE